MFLLANAACAPSPFPGRHRRQESESRHYYSLTTQGECHAVAVTARMSQPRPYEVTSARLLACLARRRPRQTTVPTSVEALGPAVSDDREIRRAPNLGPVLQPQSCGHDVLPRRHVLERVMVNGCCA